MVAILCVAFFLAGFYFCLYGLHILGFINVIEVFSETDGNQAGTDGK